MVVCASGPTLGAGRMREGSEGAAIIRHPAPGQAGASLGKVARRGRDLRGGQLVEVSRERADSCDARRES